MSPTLRTTILSATELAAALAGPRARLVEALTAVRLRGVVPRRGELGVVAGLMDWHPDRLLRPQGVSLAGAVLLHLQPEPLEGEEPVAAAARALDVSLAWMEGAEDAWEGVGMSGEWLRRPDADLYVQGHEAGAEVAQLAAGLRGW